jgi:hypothetical protein
MPKPVHLLPSILAIVLAIPALTLADDVRIRSAVANVRTEGSTLGTVVFQLKAGDTAKLLETAGDWLRIETRDGRRGWVSKTVADVVATPTATAPAATAPPARGATPGASTRGAATGSGATLTINHKDVACVLNDRYPRLDACFQPAGELGNGKVLFRAGDGKPWYAVDLMPEGGCHVAYLPKPLEATKEIQYFVSAVDKAFNARQQPDTAPETAYRARVVRNQGECDRLKLMATSVKKLARPIVVAAGRTGMGAPAALGALLVGFSGEGVVLATAAAAAGVGATGAGVAAGTSAGAGGGGIGTSTLAIAGGAVAAAGLVAVAAGGGEEGQECMDAREIQNLSGGSVVAVDNQTFCSTDTEFCRGNVTLRACIGGLCTNSCTVYYELSDGRRFPCGPLPNCFAGSAAQANDPTFCLAAAQQVVQVCN